MNTVSLKQQLIATWEAVVSHLPEVGAALGLAVLGWFVAQLGSRGIFRLTLWAYSALNTVPAIAVPTSETGPKLISRIVFWVIFLAFLAAATSVLGLDLFSQWLQALLAEVPGLIAAAMVVFAGIVSGQLARELVASGAAGAGFQYPGMLGMLVQTVVLTVSAVIGLELLGLDATVLVVLATLVLGTAGLALALAFAWGAQRHVGNLLGARDLRRFYQPGDRIRVGEWEGTILHLSARAVLMDAQEGRILIPAAVFSEQASLLLTEDTDAR